MLTGYLNPLYAESLTEFGTPRELTHCGGWILERSIPQSPYRDAMGSYPIFICHDWSQLTFDLEAIGNDLVSLALVTDPFGDYTIGDLKNCFTVVSPFKEHFVVDLHLPINEMVSRHHRYYARKALENIQVEICEEPIRYLDEWVTLYAALTRKHNVRGIRAFSREAFTKQLNIPGLVMFRALYQGSPVGAALCFLQGEFAYGHLLGISEEGYELGVGYALYWSHITYLAGKVRWLDWGGTSGVQENSQDGLSQFKRGWSTETRTVYFCGLIMNPERYKLLSNIKKNSKDSYFPIYRNGEME
jgi:hypothetical protein